MKKLTLDIKILGLLGISALLLWLWNGTIDLNLRTANANGDRVASEDTSLMCEMTVEEEENVFIVGCGGFL